MRLAALLPLLFPAQAVADRYAIFLAADPARVNEALHTKKIAITGTARRLARAIFVEAPPQRLGELRAIPGVAGVVPLGSRRLQMNRAATLINAPTAWSALGGIANAGLGMKIGIVDSGIDQNHRAFQDPTLPAIPCAAFANNNCAFTNNKVIVARSYIRQLGVGATVNPATSRPDDFSPADRVGHGTAVAMIAAGNTNTSPQGAIAGIAPKAYLGNYKVRGSNGINEIVTDDVLILALEDALADGMDVVNISIGSPASVGPLDSGAACGQTNGVPCDPLAAAVESAVNQGMVVVCSAGDGGESGLQFPSLSGVTSPANSPSAIAVAATSNSHVFQHAVQFNGNSFAAQFGDGPLPAAALTAPLRDAATACSALAPGSLAGDLAIVSRSIASPCNWPNQVANVAAAGAVGVIFTQSSSEPLVAPTGLAGATIPFVQISLADGAGLRAQLTSSSQATIDPAFWLPLDATANAVEGFSSRGPGLSAGSIKPDLAAVGGGVYTAAESLDPSGELYSPNGYAPASGTSFASPMVAGAAALVKQANKGYSPAQIKSALIDTASGSATDGGLPAAALTVGAGILNVGNAVATTVTASPASVSLRSATLPLVIPITLANSAPNPVNLFLSPTPNSPLSLDQTAVAIAPGQIATVNATISGNLPGPGEYEWRIAISGGPIPLAIPFQYVIGDGVPHNIVAISGDRNDGTSGQAIPDATLAFQVTDQFGIPVANVPATFTAPAGGSVSTATTATNSYGVAQAQATFGSQPGPQVFTGSAGGLTYSFLNSARPQPTIFPGGVVDAASGALGPGIVAGSYISIYGSNLSDTAALATTASLPPALKGVSVSFDVSSANVSAVGHVISANPGQLNVQVPWEVAGYSSVRIKVNIGRSNGALVTVPLAANSPNFFLTANPIQAVRSLPVSLYANGLGPVSNQPASGSPPAVSAFPLSVALNVPTVTIGGIAATVQFCGLAPGFAGLYQLNVLVPANAPTGLQPIAMSQGGIVSNSATLNIQ